MTCENSDICSSRGICIDSCSGSGIGGGKGSGSGSGSSIWHGNLSCVSCKFQKTGPAVYSYKRYSKRRKKILHPFITIILTLECASSVTTVVRLTQEMNLRANHKGSDTNDISKTWLPQWKYD